MRIIEFTPGGYRNLPAYPVYFTPAPAHVPDEGCSIRFLVGPNGVGKTNLLRFLAGIFLAINDGFRRPVDDNPAYSVPFRLVYGLRGGTIVVQRSGPGRSGVQFTIDGNESEPGDIPAADAVLPAALLVYTSGDAAQWQSAFRAPAEEDEEDESSTFDLDDEGDDLQFENEQPPTTASNRYGLASPLDQEEAATPNSEEDEPEQATMLRPLYLVEAQHLPLALLATLLDVQAKQEQGQERKAAFDEALAEIDVQLIAFSLYIDLSDEVNGPLAERALPGRARDVLRRLYELSTLPLQAWGVQQWVYNLSHIQSATQQSTLVELSEQVVNDPFQFFQVLVELQQLGVLRHLDMVVNYRAKSGHSNNDKHAPRTLLAESLSDGEFSFLARMALIYLLDEAECLFLLDEPEVHFNDDWKRNLVDSIEQALRNTNSEVILTSHASVTLTDAFPDEVVLLGFGGQEQAPLTLGAEPGEILRRLFKAERTVGKRAMRRIEDALENGSDDDLNQLLDEVGTGFYRFKIVEELQKRVSSDQSN